MRSISDTEEYKNFCEEFQESIIFLEDFTNLVKYNGRVLSFITIDNFYIINTLLLESSISTLKSIKLCSSFGNFSDSNTLIRKLRDDLLLYIYIINVVNNRKKLELNSPLNIDDIAVKSWLENTLNEQNRNIKMKISFENYMNYFKKNENIDEILKKYNLEKYWDFLRKKLNDYVHNNGITFSKHNILNSNNKNLKIHFNNIAFRTNFILTFFVILILMIDSISIASTDIIDYLEADLEYPEGCQYEIAPFVQTFIDTKVIKVHPQLKEYLKSNNNNGMNIE